MSTAREIASILRESENKIKDKYKTYLASDLESQEEEVSYFVGTSSFELQRAIGIPGFPNGFTELIGKESSFKSTALYDAIKHAQKLGLITVLLETESSLHEDNIGMLRNIGVDLDELLYKRCKVVEDGFEYLDNVVRTAHGMGKNVFCGIDSLANMVSRSQLKKGYQNLAGSPEGAKAIKHALKLFSYTVEDCDASVVVVNHAQDKIDMGFAGKLPKKPTSPGGQFLKFLCRLRLLFTKADAIKEGKNIIGYNVKIDVLKNKLADDGMKVVVPFLKGKGIKIYSDMVNTGLELGVLKKGSRGMLFEGNVVCAASAMENELETNKQLRIKVRKAIKAELYGAKEENVATETQPQ